MGESDISMCIYSITHIESGRTYIGQTKRKVKERWKAHISGAKHSRDSHLGYALKKHGAGAFKFEVVAVCESIDQLDYAEEFWIGEVDTLHPAGFNLNTGGRQKEKFSEISKKSMSEAAKLRFKDPKEKARRSEGAKLQFSDPEQRALISKATSRHFEDAKNRERMSAQKKEYFQQAGNKEKLAIAQRKGWDNPQSRERAAIAMKNRFASGVYDHLKVPVILSDGRIFESATACAKEIGSTQSNVRRSTIGGGKVKGFTAKIYQPLKKKETQHDR